MSNECRRQERKYAIHNTNTLITHYSLLVTLEIGEPVTILPVLALGNGEEAILQGASHFAGHGTADVTVIHFADRCDLGGSTSKEYLIRKINLVAGEALFF